MFSLRLIIFAILMAFNTYYSNAQKKNNQTDSLKLFGIVFDEDKTPFEDVVVKVLNKNESTFQGKTNINGFFSIVVPKEYFENDSLFLLVETEGYVSFRLLLDNKKYKTNSRIEVNLKNKLWPNGYPR